MSHWTLTTLISITITATQPLNSRFMVHATGSLQNPWTSNGRIPNPEILAPSCPIHCFIYNLWGKMMSHGRRAISKSTAVSHRFKENICRPAKKCLLRDNNYYFHVFGWLSSILVFLATYFLELFSQPNNMVSLGNSSILNFNLKFIFHTSKALYTQLIWHL